MFEIKNIYEPTSLNEALALYAQKPELRVIAGGTDVLIHLHHGKESEIELLSIGKCSELNKIQRLEDGTLSIGAMVNFSQLFRDALINHYIPILAEAAVSMGGPQIRNMATIGGNVCNGAVSADSATSLFVLNTVLQLETIDEKRFISIKDFYEGPGKVRLRQGELLTALLIKPDEYLGFSGKYTKFSERKAMDIAKLSVAVLCKIENGLFSDVRISLGVAAPTPIRCTEAENYAIGKPIQQEVIQEISRLTLNSAKARDSWRGSKAFREHLIVVLTERALTELTGGKKDEQ